MNRFKSRACIKFGESDSYRTDEEEEHSYSTCETTRKLHSESTIMIGLEKKMLMWFDPVLDRRMRKCRAIIRNLNYSLRVTS